MRHILLALAILLCPAAPALAQVTVDLRALDALPHAPEPPAHHPVPRPAPPPAVAATQPTAPSRRSAVATAQPTAPASRPAVAAALPTIPAPRPGAAATQTPIPARAAVAAAQPSAAASKPPPAGPPQPPPPPATLPVGPPALASIAPIQPPAPPANAPPSAPPPIVAGAATTAAATPAGLRLTFASGQSDLSPGSAVTIKQLVQAAPTGDTTTFNVLAYSSGDPDDPSVARRLSLARAITVRAALMADGVPSTRIYLRALGAQPGEGPPDRVDLSVLGTNASRQ